MHSVYPLHRLLGALAAGTLCLAGGMAAAPAPADYAADFAYYPSSDAALVRVDFAKLPERSAVRAISESIRRQGEDKMIATRTLQPAANGLSLEAWPLPVLGEGKYELTVRLEGTGAPEKRIAFERTMFPWEHNSLGQSATVVAPFTPLAVEHGEVKAVLRSHAIGDLGLWQQVSSAGEKLFRQPMRLELRRGGRTEQISGGPVRFVEKTATRIVTESRFAGGTARAEWDYDGAMRWTLELTPDPRPIEALTLVVSLDDRLVPLLHACTDGIRFNYAGYVPAGTGRVWDGTMAQRRTMLGSYVPYIWVGAEERGLAVFGENDRGWETAPDTPCQELRRNNGTLELRLNLIARPTVIAESRRITLGFQATPTKPMPADWRLWTMGGAPVPGLGAKHFAFIGSAWSWGALTPCIDFYPRDEDFGLWDEFARVRKAGKFDPAVLETWLARISDPAAKEKSRIEVGYGFRTMQGRPDNVLVYTNPRGVRFDTPEGRTFLNEWHRLSFPKRAWSEGEGPWFDANLNESFRDYAVWHYRKMLETFVDGIYWDDTFLQSTYVPFGTEAYNTPAGKTQPAAGLWAMRELIRRTAVLGVELGRPPANMLHTTNAAIAPILSFGQMLYTWEDNKGDADFQDRHTRDYIRAESLGRQHGAVPFAMLLTATKDPAKIVWINRTGTGVLLVHEIKTGSSVKEWRDAWQKLLTFGYGQPEVRVFNYWAADNPVTVAGTDAATLTLARPGRALVVVCDYGQGGELTLALPHGLPGLSGRFKASDIETGVPLTVTPDGLVHFQLTRHDFKLIGLEAEPGAKG